MTAPPEHDDATQKDLVSQGDEALREGLAAKRSGELEQARAAYIVALERYTEAGADDRAVLALINRGALEQAVGDHAGALAVFEEAKAISEALDDQRRIAVCEGNIAALYLELGRDGAEELLESALARFEELEDDAGIGNQLGNLGMLYQRRGEYEKALAYLERAAVAFVNAGNGPGAAATLRVLGDLHRRLGDTATADDAFQRALYLSRQLKDVQGEAYARRAIGQLRLAAGEIDVATGYFRAALSLHEQAGDVRGVSAAYLDLGQALIGRGDVEEGIEHLEKAARLARQIGSSNESLGSALLALGTQLGQGGAYGRAVEQLREAQALYDTLGDPYGATASRLNRASLDLARGQWDAAQEALDACQEVIDEVGMQPLAPSVMAMRGQLSQLRGDFVGALEAFGEAAERFEAVGRLRLAATARISRALMFMELMDPDEIEGADDMAAELDALREGAVSHHNPGGEADAIQAMAELARVRGAFDEALERFDQAIALVEKTENPAAIAGLSMNRAEVRLRSIHWKEEADASSMEAVEADLSRAIALAEKHELSPRLAMSLTWRADCLRRGGELDEAETLIERAQRLASGLGYRVCLAVGHQVRARVAADRGQQHESVDLADDARQLFRRMGARQHVRELEVDFPDYWTSAE